MGFQGFRGNVGWTRLRSQLIAHLLHRLQDQGGLVGDEHQFQADHAAGQQPFTDDAVLGRRAAALVEASAFRT